MMRRPQLGNRRAWLVGSPRAAIFGWIATACASLAVFPVLFDKGFMLAGLFIAALLVAVGVVLRALRVHWAVVVLVQIFAFLEWVVVAYGHRQATAVVVPNPDVARHVTQLIREGVQTANLYQAPIPNVPGLELMLIASIVGVALAVDLVATSLRRAPWAGLPLLAIYIIPIATLRIATNWPYFVIGALGYTTLLMADEQERVAHWGRVVPRSERVSIHDAQVDTSAITWLGRRISIVAMTLAIVMPWLVPDVSAKLFSGSGTGPGDQNGSELLAFDDPLVSLAHNLQRTGRVSLLTVVSKQTVPEYLRLAVVDQAGPGGWTPTDPNDVQATALGTGPVPALTGLDSDVQQRPFSMGMTPQPALGAQWLPVPYNIRRVDVSGYWLYDAARQVVLSGTGGNEVRIPPYTVEAATVEPTEAKLQAAPAPPSGIETAFGRAPKDLPPTIRDRARQITEGATTEYDKARAIQHYLRDRSLFKYDTDVGYGKGYQGLVNFLLDGRGFCQQFAAAMAYLARAVGLPTRIAIGLLSPFNSDKHTYEFTSQELHAWPEIYFSGVGWVRFEPTPAIAQPPRYAGGTPSQATSTGALPTISGHHTTTASTKQLGGSSPNATNNDGSISLPSRWWLVFVAVLTLVFGPAMIRVGLRRSRLARAEGEDNAPESAWRELRDRIRDLRLPWPKALTPRARRADLAPLIAGDDAGLAALDRLTLSVERSRFARTPLSDAHPIDDMRVVTASIASRQDRRARLVAYFLPRSLWSERDRSRWAFWRRH
jgi:transglutaminase-like putative cysteine protease